MRKLTVLDFGVPTFTVFLCHGHKSFLEIADDLKKNKCNHSAKEASAITAEFPYWADAFVFTLGDHGANGTILWVKDLAPNFMNMMTLVHETNHLVYFASRNRQFQEELEFRAYLHEEVMRRVTLELWGGKRIEVKKYD